MRWSILLIKRNLKLFWRNKLNVLLSIASILIITGLYVIFLRDFIIQIVENSGLLAGQVEEFTDRLILAGLLIVINTTTSFGMMQLSVCDSQKHVKRDYLLALNSRLQLEIGYWCSGILISFGFTFLTLIGEMLFFARFYESPIVWDTLYKGAGILFFSSCMNGGILLCMIRYMKDTASFSTFGNLYGMVCGFLAGAYLPYGVYPKYLREILYYFPPLQLTSMIRRICLADMQDGTRKIGLSLYRYFGVELVSKEEIVTVREQWSYLIFTLILVFLLILIEYREQKSSTIE